MRYAERLGLVVGQVALLEQLVVDRGLCDFAACSKCGIWDLTRDGAEIVIGFEFEESSLQVRYDEGGMWINCTFTPDPEEPGSLTGWLIENGQTPSPSQELRDLLAPGETDPESPEGCFTPKETLDLIGRLIDRVRGFPATA